MHGGSRRALSAVQLSSSSPRRCSLCSRVSAFFYFWRSGKARKAHAERCQGERELRKQFEAVVSSTRDGVLVLTEAGEVAMISDVAARMLGVRRDDAIGKLGPASCRARGGPQHASDLGPRGARADGTTQPRTVGVPGRRGADDVRWLHVRSRARVATALRAARSRLSRSADPTGLREAAEAISTAPTPSSARRWRTRQRAWRSWTSSGASWRSTGRSPR